MGDIDVSTSRRALLSGALGLGGLAALTPGGAALAAPVPVDPNSSYFLKLTGVDGESTSTRHPREIELLTFGFGATSSVDPLTTTGGRAGKSRPGDFVFVSRASKASPVLYQLVCMGKRVKQAVLTVMSSGESSQDYLVVTLSDAAVTSYQVAPGETDGFPLDVVRLAYAKISYSYRPQNRDGTVGSPVTLGFDFASNRAS